MKQSALHCETESYKPVNTYSKSDHISQGSVTTCLECDGIFNDYFSANSLQSTLVKKILKLGQLYMQSVIRDKKLGAYM